MNVINISMRPVQVNTKFLNNLQLEWNKFVTDVKLARDLHTTNFDQLYSYLEQHEAHANETRLKPSHYSNDRVNMLLGVQTMVVIFGLKIGQGESHMARQCTQLKRPKNAAWFKEKAMLTEAQEARQNLDEEQLAVLADPGIPYGKAAQTTIPNTAAFQTKYLDAYDSNCDDVSNAKAVLMANLFNYGSDIISEVPHFEPYQTDMDNQSLHAMQETQQAAVQDTNLYAQDSMILSVIEQMSEQMINHVNNWEKANQEKNNESLTAELERYKE
ncbi:hypothetical protein Tco_1515992 [Tanacetum coccineum]